MGVSRSFITAYHTRCSALCEHSHTAVNLMLAKCIDTNQRDWTAIVPGTTQQLRSPSLSPSVVILPPIVVHVRLYAPRHRDHLSCGGSRPSRSRGSTSQSRTMRGHLLYSLGLMSKNSSVRGRQAGPMSHSSGGSPVNFFDMDTCATILQGLRRKDGTLLSFDSGLDTLPPVLACDRGTQA